MNRLTNRDKGIIFPISFTILSLLTSCAGAHIINRVTSIVPTIGGHQVTIYDDNGPNKPPNVGTKSGQKVVICADGSTTIPGDSRSLWVDQILNDPDVTGLVSDISSYCPLDPQGK